MLYCIPADACARGTPNLPTKIIPAMIAWVRISGKLPMDMRIPPLESKIMLESILLKSRILVRRSAVGSAIFCELSCLSKRQLRL